MQTDVKNQQQKNQLSNDDKLKSQQGGLNNRSKNGQYTGSLLG